MGYGAGQFDEGRKGTANAQQLSNQIKQAQDEAAYANTGTFCIFTERKSTSKNRRLTGAQLNIHNQHIAANQA